MNKNITFLLGILLATLFVISCGSTKKTSTANSSISNKNDNEVKRASNRNVIEGNKHRLDKELAQAKTSFEKAIALNANNDAAHFYLGKLNLEQGNQLKAIENLEKAYSLDNKNKYYKEALAEAYGTSKLNINKGIALYEQLISEDKRFAEKYYRKKFFLEIVSGNKEAALKTLEQLEKSLGSNTEITEKKLDLLKGLKKYDAIIATCDKLIAENPNDVNSYLLKIEMLHEIGDKQKAAAFTKEVETKFANDPRMLPAIALKALDNKDTSKYLLLLDKVISNKEITPEQKATVILPIIDRANTDKAMEAKLLQYGKQIFEATPSDNKAALLYANILFAANEYKQAIPLYKQVISTSKNNIQYWENLLISFNNIKEYDSVIAWAKKGMDFFPNQASLHYYSGVGQQAKKNYTAAVKAYNTALDFAEGNNIFQANIYGTLGDLYNETKNYKASDSSYEAALAINKNDLTILNNYAYFLSLRNEKLDKAEAMSLQSLNIDRNKTFLDTYAWILYKKQNYSQALKIMQEALAKEGNNDATMLEHLGDIYYKLGDKQNAIEQWKKAKALAKENANLDKKINSGELLEQ
jgi:tetratricopeptide (TPR) repeat protein